MTATAPTIELVATVIGWMVILRIILAAFRADRIQGILCAFVPLYVFYYAVARFESPRKSLLVATLFVCALLVLAIELAARVPASPV